jgi:hypothetical protein
MWTRGCHMKSKKTPKEILNAYRYVDRHREEGDVVHRWISVDDLARELSN